MALPGLGALRRLNFWTIGSIVVADQIVKQLVGSRLGEFQSVVVIPDLLNLPRVHNTGVAYGFLDGVDFPGKTIILALVAGAAVAALAMYAAALDDDQRLTRTVLDFVDFYRNGWHFWAFNVADAAITAGVVLMILDILVGMRRPRVSRAV